MQCPVNTPPYFVHSLVLGGEGGGERLVHHRYSIQTIITVGGRGDNLLTSDDHDIIIFSNSHDHVEAKTKLSNAT